MHGFKLSCDNLYVPVINIKSNYLNFHCPNWGDRNLFELIKSNYVSVDIMHGEGHDDNLILFEK